MDALIKHEKAKYEALWEHLPEYRESSPGLELVGNFLQFFQSEIRTGQTLIDFGCGTGQVVPQFLNRGLFLSLVDLSSNCLDQGIPFLMQLCPDQLKFYEASLWDLPKNLLPSHWIYCCDVLEHIPEDKIDQVLQAMASRTKRGGYLSISLCEDKIGKIIREPLHLTVKPRDWWQEKISQYWQIVHAEPLFNGTNLGLCLRSL